MKIQGKTLGEELKNETESAAAWVTKIRNLELEKKLAEERAKKLDQLVK